MRQICKDIIQTVIDHHGKITGPILEIGSNQGDQLEFANLRPMFPGQKYVGVDMIGGPGVDIVYDACQYVNRYRYNCILCVDALEHFEHPQKLIHNVYQNLKYNGIFILITVFNWPIHMHPDDFYRFTPSALASLCKVFPIKIYGKIGDSDRPNTVWLVAYDSDDDIDVEYTDDLKRKIHLLSEY